MRASPDPELNPHNSIVISVITAKTKRRFYHRSKIKLRLSPRLRRFVVCPSISSLYFPWFDTPTTFQTTITTNPKTFRPTTCPNCPLLSSSISHSHPLFHRRRRKKSKNKKENLLEIVQWSKVAII